MIRKKYQQVLGIRMAYVESGRGDPIVFLHGNPTSSFLWRDVMAELEGRGRLIAPDLLGMGDSGKLVPSGANSYTFEDHRTYLDALLEVLGVSEKVTLVVHDWGSALGFDWACRHREAVKGIAYMEAIVQPIASWDDWPEASRRFFEGLRGEAGEDLILGKNYFVERVLPGSVLRELTTEEMNEYRRPFAEVGEARRPTLTWPRQIPIESTSEVPKLFVNAAPGSVLVGRQRRFCRSWPNQTEVTVPGIHFIQEDSGPEIGRAIRDWLSGI